MKNNAMGFVFAFTLGAAVGAVVSQRYFKAKYEQIAQEEIDSVKEVYSRKYEPKLKGVTDELHETDHEEDYKNLVMNYTSKRKEELKVNEPYVITPDEFGEVDSYDTVSLTYYADGVLTDERNEPIDDVDDIVGTDSLTHFGEYEDDSVFVRNNNMQTDFEILFDSRNYSDVKSPQETEE